MVLLVPNWILLAQNVPSSYEVQKIPENPDVASLGKFGDIPVNTYNGTANITVPIHQINIDGLSLPISLQYNTSGVRVNQDASWVGLGWNLGMGMTITREVNGYEDIRNLENPTDDAESIGWIYSENFYFPRPERGEYTPEITQDELNQILSAHIGNNPIDTEPDLFTVNLPSGSVKFYLPKITGAETHLTATPLNAKNFKIVYDIAAKIFEVTDPNGFLYQFDVKEFSTGYSSWDADAGTLDRQVALQGIPNWSTSQTRMMISSWKPSHVTSPFGETLTMTYEDGFYFSYPYYVESHELFIGGTANNDPFTTNLTSSKPVIASLNAFHVKYLKEITGDFGKIFFTLSGRDDLFSKEDLERLANDNWAPAITPSAYNAKKLDQVQVVNMYDEVIKTADLHYGYFDDDKTADIDKVSYLRLKLDSVAIFDQTYEFEYNNPNLLPRKDSNAIDFWGYYNGKQNTTLIPSGNRFYLRRKSATNFTFEQFHQWKGANRSSDVNYGKYGTLEKVTYPTGGYSQFFYDGHRVKLEVPTYKITKFQDNGKMKSTSMSNSYSYNFRYQYLKSAVDPTYSFLDNNEAPPTTTSIQPGETFELTQGELYVGPRNVRINATLSCSVGCGNASPSGRAVWLEDVDTGEIVYSISYDGQFNVNQSSVNLTQDLFLGPGRYRLRQQAWSQPSPLAVATASSNCTFWYLDPTEEGISYEEFEVGGPRVQSVHHYDSDGSFLNGKKYTYHSSGVLMDELIFTSALYGIYEYSPEASNGLWPKLYSSNRIRTSPSANGIHIGYNTVTERQVDLMDNSIGRIVEQYYNQPNKYLTRYVGITQVNTGYGEGYTIEGYEVAYGDTYLLGGLPITKEYINGSVLSRDIYSETDDLLTKDVYYYHEHKLNVAPFMANLYAIPIIFYLEMPDNYPFKEVNFAELDQDVVTQLELDSVYRYKGAEALKSGNAYFYDGTGHLNLTSTQTTDSNGEVITSVDYYPQDLPNNTEAGFLIDDNRTNVILKKEMYIGTTSTPLNELLFTEETVYSDTHSGVGHLLPAQIITSEGTNTTNYPRVTYERYDDDGNLIQYRSNENGVVTTLLWAHNGMYPVAKVENATFDQVATALGVTETVLMGLQGQNLNLLDNIRNELSDKMITTYKIKPLVGVLEVKDRNGFVVEYVYDAENRLYQIKDKDGNTVQQYEYNYGSNN